MAVSKKDIPEKSKINKEQEKGSKLRPHRAPRIFCFLLFIYEMFHLLSKTLFFGMVKLEISFINYEIAFPTTFASFLMWILYDLLYFLIIIGLYFWDTGKGAKSVVLLTLSAIHILSFFLYPSIMIFFGWIFVLILLIQELPRFSTHRVNSKKMAELGSKAKVRPLLIFLLVLIPLFTVLTQNSEPINVFEYYYGTEDYEGRKELYVNESIEGKASWNMISRAYRGLAVERKYIESKITTARDMESDFSYNFLIRLWYFNNRTTVLDLTLQQEIENILLDARYWYTETGNPTTIFWTENHQLSYHTAELLAGQIFKNSTFTRSGLNGFEHMARAETKINRWLDWRARYGFNEWHSNTYLNINIMTLCNLIEFAENQTLATKAAMLLDLICFDFANNYYQQEYGVCQSRIYGRNKIGFSSTHLPNRDEISDAAWILLRLGSKIKGFVGDERANALATTDKYTPPPILEHIAHDAKSFHENREVTGFNIKDGPDLGLEYTEDDLMMFWGTGAIYEEHIAELSMEFMDKWGISSMSNVPAIPEILRASAQIRGISVNEVSHEMEELTRGIGLEKAHTYTYRTPYYQLSGAQDYHKGLGGVQEQIWQATLSNDAYIFTNAPGAFDFKGGAFMGGWKPRGAFHENVGILLYDHEQPYIESQFITSTFSNFLSSFTGNRPHNHAYFPTWAFDSVYQGKGWTCAEVNGSYVALYSSNPTYWASDIELVALGKSNCWIVELGSKEDYQDFAEFTRKITASKPTVSKLPLGFRINYQSPSQGAISFGWEDDLIIDGNPIVLTEEYRWNNKYAQTNYGSWITNISFGTEQLILDFDTVTRNYTAG